MYRDVDINGNSDLYFTLQGPLVQSIVSLTSSLRVISLTVLADSIYSILIFFAEKISAYLCISRCKFNESLTNGVVSFEQLGPVI